MNLEKCTPHQRLSVEHVHGPLLVSAGAGSGKTFMLTQRIAYALLPASGPAVNSIDEVLAITFTKKAAAEIKERVKRTLRDEGLTQEALKVDGAWISTIHSMCARILRTHALELGIDPAFEVLSETERKELLHLCLDDVLTQNSASSEESLYASLFREFDPTSTSSYSTSVSSLLSYLLDKADGLRGGLDSISPGPAPLQASTLARTLLLAYEEALPWMQKAKQSVSSEKALLETTTSIELLQAFLETHGSRTSAPCLEEEQKLEGERLASFLTLCEKIARPPANFGSKDIKAACRDCQNSYDQVIKNALLGLGHSLLSSLISLARQVFDRFTATKNSLGKLDNNDLLSRTLAAFEQHPLIAQRYENRFSLVMVDEFQDTSQLQIDMITRLAGKQFSQLCTVGDAQQSIYRFRGADVNVYEKHKTIMRSSEVNACYVELSKNFRSHQDILSFVDRIFEQPQVFGDKFMSLKPNLSRASTYQGSSPRIDLILTSYPSTSGTGVGVQDARKANAQEIAKRFSQLHKDGHSLGEMVILLGVMSNADLYAEALRAEGLACVVSGGSQFASFPEVKLIASLLQTLANPLNTKALFEVLTSDMFSFDTEDILRITTEIDQNTNRIHKKGLDNAFSPISHETLPLPDHVSYGLQILNDARASLQTQSTTRALNYLLLHSGWLSRLEQEQTQGTAKAANIFKALRIIESLEENRNLGPSSLASAFKEELDGGLRESPGALSGAGGNVVRIMTIHASKGLEFPLVAVAEFDTSSRAQTLYAETLGQTSFASLIPGESLKRIKEQKQNKSFSFKPADKLEGSAEIIHAKQAFYKEDPQAILTCDPAAYRAVLTQRSCDEELAEARRKLYVGLTRASEALIVAMDIKGISCGTLTSDICSALFGDEFFPIGTTEVCYQGTESARLSHVQLEPTETAATQSAVEEESLHWEIASGETKEKPVQTELFTPCFIKTPLTQHPWKNIRREVFSYSSIAHSDPLPAPHKTAAPFKDSPEDATALGSAFHRAAQYAIETKTTPDTHRLEALAKTYRVSPAQKERLLYACSHWFESKTYKEALSWPQVQAEIPFFVQLGNAFMEGEIDLLCSKRLENQKLHAFVVDYKTGGSADETLPQILEKHKLQAQCYAYALLSQGYNQVELRFIRIEHPTDVGDFQMAQYSFTQADKDNLALVILEARNH